MKGRLRLIKGQIQQMKERLTLFPLVEAKTDDWANILEDFQSLESNFYEIWSFISCLHAQNVKDEEAQLLRGLLSQEEASLRSLRTLLKNLLAELPENHFEALLQDPRIESISFHLKEMRHHAKSRMRADQEMLASDLEVDGYHAWGQFYHTVVGRMRIPFEEKGKKVMLSVGQAFNKLSHHDRKVRKKVFDEWERAWEREADLFAGILNHIAGYRLQLYKHRGWEDALVEPLEENRMKKETLEAMWEAVRAGKTHLVKYMEHKARLIGVDRLSWFDLQAPLKFRVDRFDYEKSVDFILDHFALFSSHLADFAKMAAENGWVEAEDRPNKRPGGFCSTFPASGQTRIFMTFSGTADNVLTLAHEFGHAYHQSVINDLPYFSQKFAMNVAETASAFAELIVMDAAIRHAKQEEKLFYLDNKLQRAVSFFMDIHSRFLFEKRFYEERAKGPVSQKRLCRLMVEAQQEGFSHALEDYHPHFWASKLHFYNTRVPFYNFPYTFGFLFSAGIYAEAMKNAKDFSKRYMDLLRETGRMSVEDLAFKHLGVDLTKPEFWLRAVDMVKKDVEQFIGALKGSEGTLN